MVGWGVDGGHGGKGHQEPLTANRDSLAATSRHTPGLFTWNMVLRQSYARWRGVVIGTHNFSAVNTTIL